jgi:hypothetical protein
MQTPPPGVLSAFLAQIMPYLVGFLALVIPAFGAWVVNKLNTNHATQVATSAKVDTVLDQTDGINKNLQAHVDAQTKVIAGLQQNQKTA